MNKKIGRFNLGAGSLLFMLTVFPGMVLAQTPFFQGKTITIIQGRDPEGGKSCLQIDPPGWSDDRQPRPWHGFCRSARRNRRVIRR
ncbi:MAG: hypothetical protein FJ143_07035 [Deltaproteobacteria bacterium]|nr:hypothetical protein [Deltaproteobacteria bacterium]